MLTYEPNGKHKNTDQLKFYGLAKRAYLDPSTYVSTNKVVADLSCYTSTIAAIQDSADCQKILVFNFELAKVGSLKSVFVVRKVASSLWSPMLLPMKGSTLW